ncbi:hypothetical protein [Acinetobacter lwoffii]|uniref:hypothetical protein n=1 Tax=Acinetobacter lwoffii TaxID=28090 RepID=UPI001FF1AB6B|nr:hypothetical protein [Acinetobacter lwoffii]MCJ8512799.1 hypothetical protein [Acinetobacter lwoffii]
MKANEFVKKFGIKEAKKVLHCMDDASEFKIYMPGDTWDKPTLIDAVGLRRLVESHELIEKDFESVEIAEYEHMISGCYSEPYWIRIKQAIADVESCMEVS